jgi:hypothetical protein
MNVSFPVIVEFLLNRVRQVMMEGLLMGQGQIGAS